MIPAQAVEAAAIAAFRLGNDVADWGKTPEVVRRRYREETTLALEAAAPILLSHEREQTRLAHLDAMVNRGTASRLERAITGVLELAAPQRHMVSAAEIREWIARALEPTE